MKAASTSVRMTITTITITITMRIIVVVIGTTTLAATTRRCARNLCARACKHLLSFSRGIVLCMGVYIEIAVITKGKQPTTAKTTAGANTQPPNNTVPTPKCYNNPQSHLATVRKITFYGELLMGGAAPETLCFTFFTFHKHTNTYTHKCCC